MFYPMKYTYFKKIHKKNHSEVLLYVLYFMLGSVCWRSGIRLVSDQQHHKLFNRLFLPFLSTLKTTV